MARQKNINVTIAAQFFVSRAPRPIILEVEVATARQNAFANDYGQWTGENQAWADIAGDHALDMGAGKWGLEARCYFYDTDNAIVHQMRRYGFNVSGGSVRLPHTRRINSNKLFQELVSVHGLRIGYNN